MKTFYLSMISLLFSAGAYASPKDTGIALLKGQINTQAPSVLPGIFEISLPALRRSTLSGPDGRYALEDIPYGSYSFVVCGAASCDTFRIAVDLDTTDLATLTVAGRGMLAAETSLYDAETLSGLASDEEATLPLPAGTQLSAPDAAVRAWSTMGYRFRGYDRDQHRIALNGLILQDLETGYAPGLIRVAGYAPAWATATGYGLEASPAGSPGSTTAIVAGAGQYRQTRLSYGHANGSWANRIGIAHSTGMPGKGWALALSAGITWARQAYVPGTAYREYSGSLVLNRKMGNRGLLQLTAIIMPVTNSLRSAITQEVITLAGTPYYNPGWGYQQGQPRSARTARESTPLAMLQYSYNADKTTSIQVAAAWRSGYRGSSVLDWYDAPDPRPDYYRNLPGAYPDDPATAAGIREEWAGSPGGKQLDWDRMYAANREGADPAMPHRAAYVLGEDRAALQQYSFAAQFNRKYDRLDLQAGLYYDHQRTEHYRRLLDLLGGDYFVNVNQYAEQAFAGTAIYNQNDLNDPDRKVYTNDAYSYHYLSRNTRAAIWSRLTLTYSKVRFFLADHLAYDAAGREGLYRTGLFPGDSYGRSPVQRFYTGNGSAGICYTPSAAQSLYFNAAAGWAPPAFDQVFIAPRSRNTLIAHPAASAYTGFEAGYQLHTSRFNGSLNFFLTSRSRLTAIERFYHEEYRSFVNYVMEDVGIRHAGGELAVTARATRFMSVTAAACWMAIVYRSRPGVSIYRDNDTSSSVDRQQAYLKDYYLPGPQSLYLLALDFRLPWYMQAGIRCRAAARNYAAVNPARRTDAALGLIPPGSVEAERILQQEKLPEAYLVDLSAGKTCYLRKRGQRGQRLAALAIRAGVSNVLNRKDVVTGAYEQLRFDFKDHDPDRFPNKYSYAYGAVYTLSLSLQF